MSTFLFFLLLHFSVVCCAHTYRFSLIHSSALTLRLVVLERSCCSTVMKNKKRRREENPYSCKEKDQVSKSHFQKNMASTSRKGVEIRKFNGKNFSLWKEMMQDVLIIRRQVEAIPQLHHPNASGRECLLQHGQGDDNFLIVGEVGRLRRPSIQGRSRAERAKDADKPSLKGRSEARNGSKG